MTNPPPLPTASAPAATGSFPCAVCGSPVPADSQFCLACGSPVSTRSRASALGGPSASWAPPAVAPAAEAPIGAAQGGAPGGEYPGHPDAPAVATALVPSNYGWRVLAFVIDFAISGVIGFIVIVIVALAGGFTSSRPGAVAISGVPFLIVTLGYLVYPLVMLLMQAFLGFTVGKLIMGLRVVRSDTFGLPGLGRMIVRDLVVAAASLVFGIGQLVIYLSPLWDSRHLGLGWHDKAAHTWVIDVRRGPNPLRPATAVPVATSFAPPATPATPGAAPLSTVTLGAVPTATPGTSAAVPFAPPVPSAATDSAAPAPAADDIDDSTRLSAPRSSLPAAAAAALPAPAEAPAAGARGFTLRFDTGETVSVTRDGLLGRDPAPSASGAFGAAEPLLIAVPGAAGSVSKTHLEFGFGPDSGTAASSPEGASLSTATTLWIADRASTNGTVLFDGRTGDTSRLLPGVRRTLDLGDTVTVGTRSFTLEEAR